VGWVTRWLGLERAAGVEKHLGRFFLGIGKSCVSTSPAFDFISLRVDAPT